MWEGTPSSHTFDLSLRPKFGIFELFFYYLIFFSSELDPPIPEWVLEDEVQSNLGMERKGREVRLTLPINLG